MSDENMFLSEIEKIKLRSRYLRGTIRESLLDETTGSFSFEDQQLIKFHGMYQQVDRILDRERRKQGLGSLYSFMVRAEVPGGVVTPQQWLVMDGLAEKYGIGSIKLTTRQTFEIHGISKHDLKRAVREIGSCFLSTFAASGDVNRNVMASASSCLTRVHAGIHKIAKAIQARLSPHTSAYQEIWIDNASLAGEGQEDQEPLYRESYLPRKFKIAIALPPVNDTDIFANDVGLIAIVEKDKLIGFNVVAGGGMGSTWGMSATFPRLGSIIGYVPMEKIVDVCEKIIVFQRDNGDRANRKTARLKYTLERMGIPGFKAEIERLSGYRFEEPKVREFVTNGDSYGWQKDEDGQWRITLFIEGGRVKDTARYPLRTGLREIARIHQGSLILTGNQNIVIANISEIDREEVVGLLEKYKISQHQLVTGARLYSLACASLPRCPLALAEAETYLPMFMDKLDDILLQIGLKDVPLHIRMTGCPNGCARPNLGEIGLIGRSAGKYNLYLGGSPAGNRINILYRENIAEEEILSILKDILTDYAKERDLNEHFGDFFMRKEVVIQDKF